MTWSQDHENIESIVDLLHAQQWRYDQRATLVRPQAMLQSALNVFEAELRRAKEEAS